MRRERPPLPYPFLPEESKQYHFVAFSKAKKRCQCISAGNGSRIHQFEFPKPAHIPAPSLLRPDYPADFLCNSRRAGLLP